MTDETKKHVAENGVLPENGAEPLQEEAGTAAADETTGVDGSFDNAEALLVLVEGLKGENADLKDRYLRLAADMDNLRRRTERDVKDAKSYAVAGFARDMLTVSDNLRRALDLLTTEQREAGDEGFKALIEGVEMTERAMLTTLERHGVRKQEPEGQKFDPNFHQAMFEVPNADVPNNTVIQVVQDGYVIGERVLRPAMVGVSKGGPKQAAEPQPDVAEVEAEAQPSAEAEASPAEAETAPDEQANKDA